MDALGHDAGTWNISAKATCTASGEKLCTCTRCGQKIDKQTIPATGHDDGVWKITYEATADHEGGMRLCCTKCDCILDSKTFELHTHAEGSKRTLLPAGCMTDGQGGVICSICGGLYETYTIPQLGHDYSDWYTNHNGTHSRVCSRCHDLETNNCNYVDLVTEATCEAGGYTTHTCLDCGFEYVSDFKKPLGHDWSDWTDDENDSTHSRTCIRCALTETELHDWADWSYNHDACLFRQGTKSHVCAVCNAIQTEKAHHTSWLCRVFYPIGLFICNFFNKIVYGLSLNWLFPWLTIPYGM